MQKPVVLFTSVDTLLLYATTSLQPMCFSLSVPRSSLFFHSRSSALQAAKFTNKKPCYPIVIEGNAAAFDESCRDKKNVRATGDRYRCHC